MPKEALDSLCMGCTIVHKSKMLATARQSPVRGCRRFRSGQTGTVKLVKPGEHVQDIERPRSQIFVTAFARGLAVIEAFEGSRQPLTLAETAARTDADSAV